MLTSSRKSFIAADQCLDGARETNADTTCWTRLQIESGSEMRAGLAFVQGFVWEVKWCGQMTTENRGKITPSVQ